MKSISSSSLASASTWSLFGLATCDSTFSTAGRFTGIIVSLLSSLFDVCSCCCCFCCCGWLWAGRCSPASSFKSRLAIAVAFWCFASWVSGAAKSNKKYLLNFSKYLIYFTLIDRSWNDQRVPANNCKEAEGNKLHDWISIELTKQKNYLLNNVLLIMYLLIFLVCACMWLCACATEFMRSGIMRSFFSRSPSVHRVGGSDGGRLERQLNIWRKKENKEKKHKSNIEEEKGQLRHENVILYSYWQALNMKLVSCAHSKAHSLFAKYVGGYFFPKEEKITAMLAAGREL